MEQKNFVDEDRESLAGLFFFIRRLAARHTLKV